MTDPRYPIGRFSPPPSYTPDVRAAFIGDLAALPRLLRQALDGLDVDQRLTPYREGGWTVAQVVHHLADSHINAYVRVKLAVTESEPTIKPYDEKAWAELVDGSQADLEASLRLLDGLHERWVTFARHLGPEAHDRPLVHPERGPMTVDRCHALYAWHGRHHVAHVTALRARMGW
jgi:uncharacterized damage-inducible protein DinB